MKVFSFSIILSILVLWAAEITVADICPPPEVLRPCTCSEDAESITCRGVDVNVKEVLDRVSEHVNDDVVFLGLFIQNTTITEIEDGAVEQLKFQWITIYGNLNLTYISPRAFNATRNVTNLLQLSRNKLGNDVYDVVNSFEKLQFVYLAENNLTSVPNNSFQNHSLLEIINLSSNNISQIGSRAFATGTDNLTTLTFSFNPIPSEGLREDAFDDLSNSTNVFLLCNMDMNYMEEKSFQNMLDRANNVTVGGSNCDGNVNSTRQFDCDGRADWICDNEDGYRPKLNGFLCRNETGYADIWEYCGNRTRTEMLELVLPSLVNWSS